MGVWIETAMRKKYAKKQLSHPAWVCGLKQQLAVSNVTSSSVTPCVGVWIETNQVYGYPDYPGHTLRGCVD